jgi:endothelin-converting enzyme/putative endopeptidase
MILSSGVYAGTQPVGIQTGDLNKGIDACVDFYEYANGTWRANNPIPPSMVRWSRRFAAGEATKDQLKEILELASKNVSEKDPTEKQIGDFYASCMNEELINSVGIKPLKPYLDQIDLIQDAAGVQNALVTLHQLSIFVPFGIGGFPDSHNPVSVIAYIYAGGLSLPDRDYYLRPEPRFEEARAKYREHISKMFTLAGSDAASAASSAEVVLKIETKLAENSLDTVSLRNPNLTDHKMRVQDLEKIAPRFQWRGYLKNIGVAEDIDLNVMEPKFMEEFNRQIGQTPIQEWKTYLKWHLLHASASMLSSDLAEEDWNFNGKYLSGAREMKPRWKRCVEFTDQFLGEALGKKYTDRYFPPEAKASMQELVKNLLSTMKDDIESRPWMGADTKKKALEKLSTFNPKIGYPDRWKDYSSVKISRDAFFENIVAGSRFSVSDDISTIGKPVDRGRWEMTPPTSNAYYNPLLNEIVFPAGILQPPAFDLRAADAVNYGAIGVVIGHEITHGFDDQGAKFDAQGRLNNWWTESDLKQFQDRGSCIANQFDNYFIEEGVHHNGKLVLGESIGDLGGAKIAFMAWKKSLKGKPAPEPIDGFSPEQQFFISWGQFRGDAIRIEQQRVMVQSDPHPTGKYRVNGPLSNMPEFQQAFGCKADAPMVRPSDKRCEVW